MYFVRGGGGGGFFFFKRLSLSSGVSALLVASLLGVKNLSFDPDDDDDDDDDDDV